MANDLLIGAGANSGNNPSGNNSSSFSPLNSAAFIGGGATEANRQSALRAGTLTNLRFYLSAVLNGSSIATGTSRINGSSGTLSAASSAGATGEFEDVTHSDSLSDGDLADVRITSSGGLSVAVSVSGAVSVQYAATSAVTASYGSCGGITLSDSAVSAARFARGVGQTSNNSLASVETDAQSKLRGAGTLSAFRVAITVNGAGNPTTAVVSRINAASGNLAVSLTPGTTGVFTDATHSDSVASGDLLDYQASSGGVSRTVSYDTFTVTFVSSVGVSDLGCGIATNSFSTNGSTSVRYAPLFGTIANFSAEASAQARFRYSTVLQGLRLYLSSNTASNTVTAKLRQNGADANSTVSSGSGTSGWFEDVTHTDSIASGDLLDISHLGSTSGSYTMTSVLGTLGVSAVTVALGSVAATSGVAAFGPQVGATGIAAAAAGAVANFGIANAGNVTLTPAAAVGAVARFGLEIDSNVSLIAAAATGALGTAVPNPGVNLAGVAGTPSAGQFSPKVNAFAVFPVLGLMRNVAVPALAAIDDSPVAVIAVLPPGGIVPRSVAQHLIGVSATGRAGTMNPSRNVSFGLVAAAAVGVGAAVVPAA